MTHTNRIIKLRKLSHKVWLSITVLLLAYCAVTAISFVSKTKMRNEMDIISRCSMQSIEVGNTLLTNLNLQMKLYQDGVLTTEKEMIVQASQKNVLAVEALETLAALPLNDRETVMSIERFKQSLIQYEKQAAPVYKGLVEGKDDDELLAKSVELGQEKNAIIDEAKAITIRVSRNIADTTDQMSKNIDRQKNMELLFAGVVFTITIFLIYFMVTKSITVPIKAIVNNLKDIAAGDRDLTKRVAVTTEDEIAEVAHWVNIFIEQLQELIREIASNSNVLNTSSEDLSSMSSEMASGVDEMNVRLNKMAFSTEDISKNVTHAASSMEQASTNVDMIATSLEQMSSTIYEIAGNSDKAYGMSTGAVSQSRKSSEKVNKLGDMVQQIGKITQVISEISEQTNLLALNATIESARAGEAGKGFAVVANEIKALARQTAEATNEIRSQISAIQETMTQTVTDISGITQSIEDINNIVSNITKSIEVQSVTTRDISGNVKDASKNISEVTQNMVTSSSHANETTKEVGQVHSFAGNISEITTKVSGNASELTQFADKLKSLVSQFKLN